MKSLSDFLFEALPLNLAKEYTGIKRDEKAEIYMNAFWSTLKDYVLAHGGNESRNKYRLYIPYTGPKPEVVADDNASAGNATSWTTTREAIKSIVAAILDERGQWIEKWNYIEGTLNVGMKDQNGNTKVRPNQKIGKLIAKDTIPTPSGNVNALDLFSEDPVRLGKNITNAINSNNLWIVISNHAYDIAGMSTNREWTSCMNIISGDNADFVKEDIKYGTLVAYIIDKKDINIEHPYGRILIKPYKLQRSGYVGFDAAPMVYSPEVTVYSPYIGLKPIRVWLKDICEEIQEGEGMLRHLKQLYNDTYHDIADREFRGRANKKK